MKKGRYIMQIGGIDDQEAVELAEGWKSKQPQSNTEAKQLQNHNKDENRPDVENACVGSHGEPYP